MDPPEYYILFRLDFCAEFPYCQTYLLPNCISDAESCHWKHWECLYQFKISPTVFVADILVGAFLGRILCSTGPLVRICLCPLGPFVPPFKTDWRICQCAEFLQCFSILQAANSAWLQVISLPFWYWWNLSSGYLYWKAILKSIFSMFPWDWQVVWVSKGSV